jgi:hypothetical protein
MIQGFWGSRKHQGLGVLMLGEIHFPVSPLATGRAQLGRRSEVWAGFGPVSRIATLEAVSRRSASGVTGRGRA